MNVLKKINELLGQLPLVLRGDHTTELDSHAEVAHTGTQNVVLVNLSLCRAPADGVALMP
jgi:hypothetical protein